jgi:hypothetical protein
MVDLDIPQLKVWLVNWKMCMSFQSWDVESQGCLEFWDEWVFAMECGCVEIEVKTCKIMNYSKMVASLEAKWEKNW